MEASRRVLVLIAVLGITSAADSNVAVALEDAVAVIAVSVETPTRRPKHLQRVSSLTRSMGTDLGLVGRGVGPQFGMPRISVARPAIVMVAITMEDKMRGSLIALAAAAALSTSIISQAAEENPADFMQFHEVEIIFHQAASTKNLDLMMALFADDATLSAGGKIYAGKAQVRNYFATVAGPFQPQNQWVAYTPAQRIRFKVNGDQANLYFECLYVDKVGNKIAAHTNSDDTLVRVNGKWLIKEMKAATVPEL
jgi:hypothetical protein